MYLCMYVLQFIIQFFLIITGKLITVLNQMTIRYSNVIVETSKNFYSVRKNVLSSMS